ARFVCLLTVQRGTSRPLHLGEQTTPVAGDHRVEVVDRRVHVHGAHAIDVTVGRGEGLDALLEFTGQIQQPAARRDGIMKSSTRQWAF
ncbi:MAG TPA: hypothetical protein VFF31_19900, partial [Blastocatellia bacterium]|nr:hypothetical protein [Blastocatellia bacterium]